MKAILIFFLFTNILHSYNLKINLVPSDSKVMINNKILSDTSKIDLKEGQYQLKVCKNNYQCYDKKFWIIDKDIALNINLLPIQATLVITSDNINSMVLIDGKKIEKGELIKFDSSKTINIKEKKDYYAENNLKFKIDLGQTYHLNLPKMQNIKKLLTINGKYPKASIRLNGKEICKGNCKKSLKFGKYNLSILKDGYFPYEKEINITNKNLIVNYKLIKKPKALQLGTGISYLYGRLLGGFPELNIELKLKSKINFKFDLIYVVNFSNDSEYYGVVLGSSYDVFRYNKILNIYLGMDLIFSKYIDDTTEYLENGIGLNLGGYIKIIDKLRVNLELTNRLHYMYNSKFYDVLGKIGLIYYF